MIRTATVSISLCLVLALVACGGKGGAGSKINEASLKKAKAMVHAPQPLADIKPQLVELLGEPTSTNGDSLYWAAVGGGECRYMELVVSGDTVNGTSGGMANEIVESEYAKCKKLAGQ